MVFNFLMGLGSAGEESLAGRLGSGPRTAIDVHIRRTEATAARAAAGRSESREDRVVGPSWEATVVEGASVCTGPGARDAVLPEEDERTRVDTGT